MNTNESNADQFNADAWPNADDYASAFAWFLLNHTMPDAVDGLELAACVDVGDGCMERVSSGEWDAESENVIFSVYWHNVGGGCDCFADFRNANDARLCAYYIAERRGLSLSAEL